MACSLGPPQCSQKQRVLTAAAEISDCTRSPWSDVQDRTADSIASSLTLATMQRGCALSKRVESRALLATAAFAFSSNCNKVEGSSICYCQGFTIPARDRLQRAQSCPRPIVSVYQNESLAVSAYFLGVCYSAVRSAYVTSVDFAAAFAPSNCGTHQVPSALADWTFAGPNRATKVAIDDRHSAQHVSAMHYHVIHVRAHSATCKALICSILSKGCSCCRCISGHVSVGARLRPPTCSHKCPVGSCIARCKTRLLITDVKPASHCAYICSSSRSN